MEFREPSREEVRLATEIHVDVLLDEKAALENLLQLRRLAMSSPKHRKALEQILKGSAGKLEALGENRAKVRRGIGLYSLGETERAISLLEQAHADRERDLFLGLAYLESGDPGKALPRLQEAVSPDQDEREPACALVEAMLLAGEQEKGERLIEKMEKKYAGSWEIEYLWGLRYDLQGLYEEAIGRYQRALEIEPGAARAAFRLAYKYDLLGLDQQAQELYERLRRSKPFYSGTLLNLGSIYEDRGEFNKAMECYEAVLDRFPGNTIARALLKDAQASLKMYYDEETLKREERLRQLSTQLISDMPLSPRPKNALMKAKILTLADLVSMSEEKLEEVPGLGQTGIREIKEFLHSKGLSLSSGQRKTPEEHMKEVPAEVLAKSLSEFQWSSRVLKLFEAQGFATISDLLRHSEKDLREKAAFGPTALREINQTLSQIGISLLAE